MARRRSFNKKDRARIFATSQGICHLCKGAIGIGEAWEVEHVTAWELTQDDSDENLRPAHVKCHKTKTHQQDRPAINRAKRREAKHTGAIRPKQSISSAGFSKQPKHPKFAKQPLPPRQLYEQVSK